MLLSTALLVFLFASSAGYAADLSPVHLPFWGDSDVRDVVGPISFRAEILEKEGLANGYPEMLFGCEVPRDDGTVWVYGWKLSNWQNRETRTVEVIRVETRNGRDFGSSETVFSEVNRDWQGFVNLVYRPADKRIFLFSWAAGRLCVYESMDGTTWNNLSREAYVGHDAMCVIWYPPLGEMLNYQNTLQQSNKRYPDNINEYRRVLQFRRSRDGVKWEEFSPPFLRNSPFWTPDEQDPIDLEFYRSVVFPTEGRYVMLLQGYYAPPPEANSRRKTTKHGPRSEVEWAVSRDGLNWSRPFREIDATEQVGSLAVQGPLVREGKLRFYERDRVITSVSEGRIFHATGRGNSEFSTPDFVMPKNGMKLQADVRYRPSEGEFGRAYLMAELRDPDNRVIEGFERRKCLIENLDARGIPLEWDGKLGGELAGKMVRIRFFFRDAKLYSVSEIR